ncbi:MAG: hypothetical protein AAF211_23130 [Myxococcota bacterium]
MSEGRPHLWMSATDPRRYFLVPRGTALPEGELEVRDLTFTSRQVVLASIEAYEVDQDTAQAHVDDGWSRVIGQARDAVREFLGQSPSDDPPDISLPFVGLTPGEVALDAEKRRASSEGLLNALSTLVGSTVDEESRTRFEERVRSLRDNLAHDAGQAAEDVTKALESGWDALKRVAGVADEPDPATGEPEASTETDEADEPPKGDV